MQKNRVEKSDMSAATFAQHALRERIAPPSIGSVKQRIVVAARKTGWSQSRIRDLWYADPRVSIKAEQLIKIEALSGLEFARQEVRTHDAAIQRATDLLGGEDSHLVRAVVAAVLQAIGLPYRA